MDLPLRGPWDRSALRLKEVPRSVTQPSGTPALLRVGTAGQAALQPPTAQVPAVVLTNVRPAFRSASHTPLATPAATLSRQRPGRRSAKLYCSWQRSPLGKNS